MGLVASASDEYRTDAPVVPYEKCGPIRRGGAKVGIEATRDVQLDALLTDGRVRDTELATEAPRLRGLYGNAVPLEVKSQSDECRDSIWGMGTTHMI